MILVQEEIQLMLNKGAIVKTPNHLEEEFISNIFLAERRKMVEPTSNKLKTPKSVHALPAPQDGGFALSSKHSKEGRLHMQTGFEGCILFISIKSCIRETLQVFLPLFWARPSTKNFYKITQSSSFSVSLPEHTNYNLLGRHVVDRPYNRRNVNGQRHRNLPSSTTRVCTAFKQISVDTYTENTLHKKWSFPLRISSVNVTKSAGTCGFGHIYWRNP